MQDGPDTARECYVACQRFGRETQHVRPTGSEALIGYHIGLVTRRTHREIVGHGRRGIGAIAAERLALDRPLGRQRAVAAKKENLLARIGRRPLFEGAPAILTGEEDRSAGQLAAVALAEQVIIEKGHFDPLLVVVGQRRVAEAHLAEPVAAVRRPPAAVHPRAGDHPARRAGTLAPDRGVGRPRAVAILGIEQAAHDQYGRPEVVHGAHRAAFAPPVVVIGMTHHLVPEADGIAQKLRQAVDGGLAQKEIVFVGTDVTGCCGGLGRGIVHRPAETAADEGEGVAQEQHAVVVRVVAHEPVGDGRLRRGGFQGGMSARGGHKGVETRIGVAVDADTPVVARDLAHQKVDRIVGVARLVDLFGRMLIGDERTEIDVFALAHVASPHILKNEDIALLQIEFQK